MSKIIWFFSFNFCQNFYVQTFSRWLSIRRTNFFTDGETHLERGRLVWGGGDSSREGETHQQRGETYLQRWKLVYGGGDSSTEGEACLWRGRFVYRGETLPRYIYKENLVFSQVWNTRDRGQETEKQRAGNRGAKDTNSGIEPQKRTLGQLIYRVQRMEDKDESREDMAGDRGRETRSRAMRQGTEDGRIRQGT